MALLGLTLTACAASPVASTTGSPSEVPRITPVPDGYDCGGEVFKVAFEEGVAYVTLPGGEM